MIEQLRSVRQLQFAPQAWLKWQYLCHAGATEVAGFGLSAIHDPLYVEDILVVGQQTTAVTVAFDDAAIADLFDRMTDLEITPDRYARIWLHSHPGASPTPSSVDEATFARAFGGCDWSIMGILSRTSATYARLQFNAGPGGSLVIPVTVDWASWPMHRSLDSWLSQWQQEYEYLVKPMTFSDLLFEESLVTTLHDDLSTWRDLLDYC